MYVCMYVCMYVSTYAPCHDSCRRLNNVFCLHKLNSTDLREGVKDDSDKSAEGSRIVRFKLLPRHLITENERSAKLLRIASACAQNRTRKSPNSCQEAEPLFHDFGNLQFNCE